MGTPSRTWSSARRGAILAALGVGLCVLLVRGVGWERTVRTLRPVADYLPLLLALELARAAAELASTRGVLGARGRAIPWPILTRAQLISHGFSMVLPLGRGTGEAIKASLILPHVGKAAALAVGAAGQLIALWVNGGVALLGALVAWRAGASPPVVAAFAAVGVLLVGVATLLAWPAGPARSRRPGRRSARHAQGITESVRPPSESRGPASGQRPRMFSGLGRRRFPRTECLFACGEG